MQGDPRVTNLLLRYDDLRAQGKVLTPEELCQECPELLAAVRRELSGLGHIDRFLDATREHSNTLASANAEAAAPPTIPGYEILAELGRGGMGVVYKARQIGLKRMVALKMILAGGHAGREQVARFRLEAEAVARLQHANIVQIYEIGEDQARPYFALEFVDGGSLSDRLTGTPLRP